MLRLSDMTGCRTLLDWSNGLTNGIFRFCRADVSLLPEHERAALVYFFLNQVSPFMMFCVEYKSHRYLMSGEAELYTMNQFVKGVCGFSRESWPFCDSFPSRTHSCFWNDIPDKEAVLRTHIPAVYALLEHAEDFRALQSFFRRYRFP